MIDILLNFFFFFFTELQNKRSERKRRSTANPQFSYGHFEPEVSYTYLGLSYRSFFFTDCIFFTSIVVSSIFRIHVVIIVDGIPVLAWQRNTLDSLHILNPWSF